MIFPAIILNVLIVLVLLEWFFPREKKATLLSKTTLTNVCHFLINENIFSRIQEFVRRLIHVFLTKYILDASGFHFQLFPVSNEIARWICLFVLYDGLLFHVHLLLHRNPTLWEIHKLHHSTSHLNVTADFRYSWMEGYLFFFADFLMIILGASVEEIAIFQLGFNAFSLFIHSNLKFKFMYLSKFINTPHLHIWHHSKISVINKGQNIGTVLVLWDKMYRTYHCPESPPEEIGFKNIENYPKSIWERIIYPLWKR